MPLNFGQIFYPGLFSIESGTVTDISGISPAEIHIECYPQFGFPDQDGDVTFTYNSTVITFKNCTIDRATFQRDSGGKIVSIKILDERWKWAYGQITGRYNIRLPNNFVDPAHEKTPQELATLCFQAMGVINFDVSALPNDARPDVDWEGVNPAQELATLCDDLGCRIVPKRSTQSWVICATGVGANLPDYYPYQDAGDGVDPKEIPDFLQIITAPTSYQVALKLEPAGRDMDQEWKFPARLSYVINENVTAYGFGIEPKSMFNVSPEREDQPDGSAISPRELALQFLYRHWRIAIPRVMTGLLANIAITPIKIYINGYNDYVTRKQIILTDKLAQCYTDERGEIHQRPAFVFGEFEAKVYRANNGNYPPGTRIDYQVSNHEAFPEERASFSLCPDPIDTDRSFVVTSQQMVFRTTSNETTVGSSRIVYDFAKLFLTCAIQIRDKTTWQPIRYARIRHIGDGSDPKNVMTVVKNDIQPWYINLYNPDGTWLSTTDNSDDVNQQCDFYLDSIEATFATVNTTTRTYIGIFPIDMDGAIQQVEYRVGKQGADTIASQGTEHDYEIPSYAERRQRDGRQNIRQRVNLEKEIAQRREATKGTFNTL